VRKQSRGLELEHGEIRLAFFVVANADPERQTTNASGRQQSDNGGITPQRACSEDF
jgi:hypothetical protein